MALERWIPSSLYLKGDSSWMVEDTLARDELAMGSHGSCRRCSHGAPERESPGCWRSAGAIRIWLWCDSSPPGREAWDPSMAAQGRKGNSVHAQRRKAVDFGGHFRKMNKHRNGDAGQDRGEEPQLVVEEKGRGREPWQSGCGRSMRLSLGMESSIRHFPRSPAPWGGDGWRTTLLQVRRLCPFFSVFLFLTFSLY